jgi:hypothetical protein
MFKVKWNIHDFLFILIGDLFGSWTFHTYKFIFKGCMNPEGLSEAKYSMMLEFIHFAWCLSIMATSF